MAGCYRLALSIRTQASSGGDAGVPEEVMVLLRKACDGQYPRACNSLGWMEFGAERDDEARKAYEVGCESGTGASAAETCYNLGTLLLFASGDAEQALAAYRKACEKESPKGCLQAAAILHPGAPDEADALATRGLDATTAKCNKDTKGAEHCLALADWYEAIGKEPEARTTRSRGLENLNTQCAAGDVTMCREWRLRGGRVDPE